MTALDQVLDEAEAKGLAKGRVEGRVEGASAVIERLLAARFGPLDEQTLGRLRGATVDQLATWGERLLSASTLAEVFTAR